MFYLIHGVFFQEGDYLAIGMDPIEGAVTVIKRGMHQAMFSGAIVMSGTNPTVLTGRLIDTFGESVLSEVSFSPNLVDPKSFSFNKKYEHRRDIINYSFNIREGNVWVGRYVGFAVGEGFAKCVITEVTDDHFFDPKSAMKKLGFFQGN